MAHVPRPMAQPMPRAPRAIVHVVVQPMAMTHTPMAMAHEPMAHSMPRATAQLLPRVMAQPMPRPIVQLNMPRRLWRTKGAPNASADNR